MAVAELETSTSTSKAASSGTLRSRLQTLRLALAAVEPAVPDRTPVQVLRNVLLKYGRVHATNNEMRISANSGIDYDMTALVPFKHLKSIAGMCRYEDTLTLQHAGTHLGIKASGGRWSFPTEAAETFPAAWDKAGQKPLARLPADQFHDLMKSVVIACAKDAGRYALNGVLIEFTDGVLSFVGTDGHRLCVASCEIDQSLDNASVLVPRKAVDAMLRISSLAGGEKAVQLFARPGCVEAWFIEEEGDDEEESEAGLGMIEFDALLLSGEFPKWRKALKEYTTQPSRTPAGALLNAIEMCAVCSSETSRGITMTVGGGSATFRASSAECGKSESKCGLSAFGDEFSVTFDPRLATDWLAMLDPSEPVRIFGENQESQLTLESINCRCSISPIIKE
jgi:DNA polymerase-3 subunit beta